MDEEEPEASFGELVGDLATEVATLVRQELALAGAEMTQKARDATRYAMFLVIGALLGAVSLLVFVGAVVLGLGSVIPMWASALVIAVLLGASSMAVFRAGRAALRAMSLLPTETFASLKADEALAKVQIAATRDQVATTIGEVRRRLVLPAAAAPEESVEVEAAPSAPPKKKRKPRKPRVQGAE